VGISIALTVANPCNSAVLHLLQRGCMYLRWRHS